MLKYAFLSLLLLNFIQTTQLNGALPQTSQPLTELTPLPIEQKPFERGDLTVICGSMCSGKSEEIIRQVGRLTFAGFKVVVFKPAIDNRKLLNLEQDPLSYIPSRNGSWINCIPIISVEEIETVLKKVSAQVIAIDEIHFFTPDKDNLIKVIRKLVESGKKVIAAGLELDFRGEPFGPMPQLLAYADDVLKLHAICHICGNDTFCLSQRLIDGKPAHYNDPLIMVGASQYEPRCRKCHIIRKD